jgi:hypothetical protein
MGNGIRIDRTAERFSSHTQARARPRRSSTSADVNGIRERLIEAMVEVVAEGGDPRLGESRARP